MNEINKERFEAWLFSQPRERVVNTSDGRNCVMCQFVKETTNHQNPYAEGWWKFLFHQPDFNTRIDLPDWFTSVIHSGHRLNYCCTYGDVQDAFRKVFPLETPTEPALEVLKPQNSNETYV